MSEFKKYLAESTKTYNFKVKIAGEVDADTKKKLKTCMEKWAVESMSSGKRTPVQEVPLDFPHLTNTNVTIFDVETAYPVTANVLQEYIITALNLTGDSVRVRGENEPTEAYQEEMQDTAEYKSKLEDSEYTDAPSVKAEEHFGEKQIAAFLKDLIASQKDTNK